MGCDIHMHVEYKPKDVWESGDYFIKTGYGNCNIGFCEDRCYDLFAVLANVRNYDDVRYIAKPRGIPRDATEHTMESYKIWHLDAHSASYFTLKELIDFYNETKTEVLEHLIDELRRRADELCLIWNYRWENERLYSDAYNDSDKIRIVFWFDN